MKSNKDRHKRKDESTMKKYDCGFIQFRYESDEGVINVTGKELNRENSEELLCYFKGGIVEFIPIKNLTVNINGVNKSLEQAIKQNDIVYSEDKRYIKLAVNK